jgi:hypothetical protein
MSERAKTAVMLNERAAAIFGGVSPQLQELARAILRTEREVMYLKRRSDIHQRIYEHVKRVIK